MNSQSTIVAFQAQNQLARAPALEVALLVKKQQKQIDSDPILLFDAESGRQLDLDISGSVGDIERRYGRSDAAPATTESGEGKRRGRPKLGVVGKEVPLVPRHWEWLEQQRGGASATLRRLIDQARKDVSGQEQVKQSQDSAQRFMTAVAGNLPGYEEAVRALYARNKAQFDRETANWPTDIRRCARDYAQHALV